MATGRPSKFTTERCNRFLEAIRVGSPYEPACQYAGFDYTTYAKWKQDVDVNGERSTYFDFFEQVKEAEGSGIVANLAIIKGHAKKQWQAAAWLLERRHPEMFARKDNLNVEGSLSVNAMVKDIVSKVAGRMAETEEGIEDQDS